MDDDATLLASSEKATAELRALLVQQLPPYVPGPGEKLLRLSFVWRETLFHRVVDLSSSALAMFREGRLIPGCTLTRALYETVANLYLFHKKLLKAVESQDLEDLTNCVIKGAWGSKDRELNVAEPLQVLTSIKHLDKEFYGAEREYFHLCEYAHPNMKGGIGTYSKIEIPAYSVNFGTNPQNLRMGPFGLGGLEIILVVAKELHDRHQAAEKHLIKTVRKNAARHSLD